jgi:7-cyano-7-deazaguanine reductase
MEIKSPAIETFPNRNPERDYQVYITCPEFTSICPRTSLPDFATLRIIYTPNKLCIELKSLKYYLFAYREQGIFYEHVVNRILTELVEVVQPKAMEVIGEFTVRGGIQTTVKAFYPGTFKTEVETLGKK